MQVMGRQNEMLTDGMSRQDVEREYGPECPDFEPECVCCRAWIEYHMKNVGGQYASI